MSGREKQLETALRVATDCLRIASDWNAPTHYDIKIPEGWEDDLKDYASDEPHWVALYLLIPKLEAVLSTTKDGERG